ncbi:MAG: type IV toxin-antitoxin system AbiEi family antitoxin domain-containing protein [Solirubrobacterales bacterium]
MEGFEAHQVIRSVASGQHGLVSRRQLLDLGVGEGLIAHAARSGRLLRVFPGVYVLGRRADSYRSIWLAAVMAAGPDAALAGESAAAAWGFAKPSSLIFVARPRGRRQHVPGSGPHRRFSTSVSTSRLLPTEANRIGPLEVCSVPAVLVQLAGTSNKYKLRRAFIEASRKGLLSKTNLAHCRSIGRDFRGMANLVELIDLWHPESAKAKSYMEGDFFLLCAKHKIPRPSVNAWVDGKEVDCLWPDERVIVELDSRTFHDDQFAFDRDRVRQNAAVVAGYFVLRFTYRRIVDEPETVMAELKAVLAARSRENDVRP